MAQIYSRLFCSMCKKTAQFIYCGEYDPGCFGACEKCRDKWIAKRKATHLKEEIKEATKFLRANGYKVSKSNVRKS